ncbi:hypothetical protein KEM56_003225 [Ascosphaera pollenicola]|nr:hypothetical protein KEM56_003225 [Ascosphaera pollenicola]
MRDSYDGQRLTRTRTTISHGLLNNLAKTRYNTGIDALAYLAIDLDRWPAAQYLFNLLLDNAEHISRGTRRGWLPCNLNWPEGRTLDQISDVNTGAILHENLCKPDRRRFAPLSQLDDYLEDLMIPDQLHPTTYTKTMSHIWSSLGSMLLRAAELRSEKAQVVMDRFRQIVGRLHHGGLIPDDVYRDASASGSRTIPGRNNALSLLSTRIMFCLSEAEFNASDADHPSGIVPPKLSIFGFKIRQRNLGVEVWLELILRCCIEGGFINEGMRIVYQTKQSQQAPWHIKPTPRILQSPLATNFDSRLIDCCDTWEECAAYAGEKVDIYPDRPFMGVGKLSVSRDTVMCILDSLANRLTVGVGPEGNAATTTLRAMGEIINFMNEDHVGLNPKERHYFAMRVLQVKSIIPEVNPKAAQSLLKLLSPELHFTPETGPSHSQDQVSETNFFLGMAQHILNIFAASGHIVGAESLMQWLLSARGTLPDSLLPLPAKYFCDEQARSGAFAS